MKLSELTPCVRCRGPLPPIWQTVRVSITMLDRQATNQTLGLAQFFQGNLALAEAMGCSSGQEIVEAPSPATFHLCQQCFLMHSINLAECAEAAPALEAP